MLGKISEKGVILKMKNMEGYPLFDRVSGLGLFQIPLHPLPTPGPMASQVVAGSLTVLWSITMPQRGRQISGY